MIDFPLPITLHKPLKDLCTFGIGGNAHYFVAIDQIQDFQVIVKFCTANQIPYIILGKGSNVLFDDRDFDGLVILNKIDFCQTDGAGHYHAGAGYSFSRLGAQTAKEQWTGLEFASGIPASVGGAVFMNAGANGKETCQSLYKVHYITENGELITYQKTDLNFSYRHSPFQSMKGAIVSAEFILEPLDSARQTQLQIIEYRKKTQPLKDKSAGCIFRNPQSESAGALIEKCGLKGVSFGEAKVSEIHANFIVNLGNARAEEVKQLIHHIQDSVFQQTGIRLESEVRFLP